jgi:hypothetical protein
VAAERLQLIGQRAEQRVDRLICDLHVPSVTDRDVKGLQSGPSTSSSRTTRPTR